MVKIRLARAGAKKRPFYHLVAADSRSPRDGRFIERLGFFNPIAVGGEARLRVNTERVDHWVAHGAQLTGRAAKLVGEAREQLSLVPEDGAPVAEGVSTEEGAPAAEAASTEEGAPAAEADSAEEGVSTVEGDSAEEGAPAAESASAEESAPTVEGDSAEAGAPTVEGDSAEADAAAPDSGEAPVAVAAGAEDAPAEDAPAEEGSADEGSGQAEDSSEASGEPAKEP